MTKDETWNICDSFPAKRHNFIDGDHTLDGTSHKTGKTTPDSETMVNELQGLLEKVLILRNTRRKMNQPRYS